MKVVFDHVLLPDIVEKKRIHKPKQLKKSDCLKKNPKKLSGKSAHLFSLAVFGVSSNGRIESHTSFENLFSLAFIICNRF